MCQMSLHRPTEFYLPIMCYKRYVHVYPIYTPEHENTKDVVDKAQVNKNNSTSHKIINHRRLKLLSKILCYSHS